MKEAKAMACSKILSTNIGTDCMPDFKPMFNTLVEAKDQLLRSAFYSILGRSATDADYQNITINTYTEYGVKEIDTIFYNDKPRATITMIFGMPVTLKIDFI